MAKSKRRRLDKDDVIDGQLYVIQGETDDQARRARRRVLADALRDRDRLVDATEQLFYAGDCELRYVVRRVGMAGEQIGDVRLTRLGTKAQLRRAYGNQNPLTTVDFTGEMCFGPLSVEAAPFDPYWRRVGRAPAYGLHLSRDLPERFRVFPVDAIEVVVVVLTPSPAGRVGMRQFLTKPGLLQVGRADFHARDV